MTIYNIIALSYLFYSLPEIYNTGKSIVKRETTVISALNCRKCYTFWITLILSGNLSYALLVSLCVLLMDSFIVTKL